MDCGYIKFLIGTTDDAKLNKFKKKTSVIILIICLINKF